VAKDRARPFSRKHRRYWLTVTGGMLLIGALNVAIGVCVYDPGPDTVEAIQPVLPAPSAGIGPAHVIPEEGMLGLGEIPVPVMRAFTKAHPQHVPQGAKKLDDGTIQIFYLEEGGRTSGARSSVTFTADGTPIN
jgi:hypothetical protein